MDSSLAVAVSNLPRGSAVRQRVIYISPSATGIIATNYQIGKKTDIPCSAICEPTVQQLATIH